MKSLFSSAALTPIRRDRDVGFLTLGRWIFLHPSGGCNDTSVEDAGAHGKGRFRSAMGDTCMHLTS